MTVLDETPVQAPPHWSDEYAAKMSGSETPTGVIKIHAGSHGDVRIEFDGNSPADLEVAQALWTHAATTLGMTGFVLFSPERHGEDRMLQRGDQVPSTASEVHLTPQMQGG